MDLSTPSGILIAIQSIGYTLMFLLFIIEGPILGYIAGFASSLGIFNVFIVGILLTLGNIIGDVIYYLIGRFARWGFIERYIENKLKNSKKIQKLEHLLKTHPGKTLTIIKFTPPLPAPGLILSGVMKMKFSIFIFYSVIISFIYSVLFVAFGYYSGTAFGFISDNFDYIGILISLVVIFFICLWFLIKYLSKRLIDKIEQV